jgi:type 1 glutamine amidotransferase
LKRPGIGILIAFAVLVGCSDQDTDATATSTTLIDVEPSTTRASASTTFGRTASSVLVFHKTEGFWHESISAGVRALEDIGAHAGFDVIATDDATIFSPDGLESSRVIVFLNTTGDVLDETQQSAMEDFISSGKGFLGVHSAADTEYDWPWYGELVGAYFDSHPQPQDAVVDFVDPDAHPVTEGLPHQIERFDEWYDFRQQPSEDVTILALVDEATYEGATMGEPHPIIWAREVHGGRSVYIGFGHTSESFEEPVVRKLLDNAIRWVAGMEQD